MSEIIIADICGHKSLEINVCKKCLNEEVRKLHEENASIFNKLEKAHKEMRELHSYAFKEYFEFNVNNQILEATKSCMKNIEVIITENGSVDEIKILIVDLTTLIESAVIISS